MIGKFPKVGPRVYGGFDADAQAFITAAGITDATQKSYVNYLAVNFKANNSTLGGSLWSRLTNIKPMVGGTSSAHSYNLQNIATFQETFVNSPTHNSLGVVFNGTTQYSFCGFIPSNELTTTQGAQIIYTQNGWSNGGCAIGALNGGVRFNIFGDYYEAGASFTLGSSPTGVGGMRSLAINGSSGFRGYVNSTQDINNITPVSGLPTIETYLGALNFPTPYRANVTISFYAQGKVSSSDISTIYTIVQAAQTILGRNK